MNLVSPKCPPPARRLRVLIAEDYKDAADTLFFLLKIWGHEVRIVSDGLAAVQVARSFRPDVALIDVAMPGLHGGEVAELLRQEPGLENILIVALSGTDEYDPALEGYESSFDEYLMKPYDPECLHSILSCVAEVLC